MDIVERIDRMGDATVVGWAATWLAVWRSACAHDGIDPEATLVVFSSDNPYTPYLNRAWERFCEAASHRRVLGYTGLVIQDGKAKLPTFTPPRGKRSKA